MIMKIDPQGRKAATNGAKFEDIIEDAITQALEIPSRKWPKEEERLTTDNVLLKNAPYESIYGTKCRSEFLLRYQGRDIRIECKYQQSAGSVDEKLPYLMMNFTQKVDEAETIIITHGDGFRDGAINWLRESCRDTKCKVFTLLEFTLYLENLRNANSSQTS
jgi:hypothetical protein